MPLADAREVGDDAGIRKLLRRLDDLENQLRMVAAASAGQTGQVDFLLNQQVSQEATPGTITAININPATTDVPVTWLPFDPTADASVTVVTSSTGRLAVQCGGYIGLWSTNFCYASGYIGIEILYPDGVVFKGPSEGDGNTSTVWSSNFFEGKAGSGHRHEWAWFAPNSEYTLRVRRGYEIGAGQPGAQARIDFQGTAIAVEKLGM